MADLGSAVGQIIINYDPSGVAAAKSDLSSLESTGSKMTKVGGALLGVGAALAAPLIGATNAAADFEFQMDAVNAALGGVDTSTLAAVEQQALDLGASTKFSAGEIGAVQEQLAKSGISAEQLVGGVTEAVTDLAAATGEGLVSSGTAAAAAINAFGLTADDTTQVADIFTNALNNSSATLPDFQRGLNNLGPVMANLNQYADDGAGALNDSAAAVSYFNAQGLKAADAGISLARGLTNILTPGTKASDKLVELGISAKDAQGDFIGFPALFDELHTALDGASDSAREGALKTLFGAEAIDVMNKAVAAGGDPLREYEKLMEQSGTAAEQAGIRQDNLRGDIENLTGSIETFAIQAGQVFLEPLRGITQAATEMVNSFGGLDPAILGFAGKVTAAGAGLATFAGAGLLATGQVLKLGQTFAASGLSLGKFAAGLGLVGLAITAGILAYETNFLGFRDAVQGALGAAGKAISTFAKAAKASFDARTAEGINTVAAAVGAFGDALLTATGIDITGFTGGLADGIQAFGAAFEAAAAQGVSPFVAALEAASAAAAAMGFEGLGDTLAQAADAAEQFGNTFGQAFETGQDQGLNDIAAAAQAVGVGLSEMLGVDVTGFFGKLADGAQAVGEQFEKLAQATQQALGQALTGLMNNVLPGFQDALGNVLGTIRDVGAELLSGDFSQAGQILGDAMGELGGAIGNAFAELRSMDWGGILGGIGSAIGSALGNVASTVGGLIGDINWDGVVSAIGTTLGAAFDSIGSFLSPIASTVGSAVGEALGNVGEFVTNINWTSVVQNVADMLLAAFEGLGSLLGNVAQTVSDAIMDQLNQIGSLIEHGSAQAGLGGTGATGVFDAIGTTLKADWDALWGGLALTPPDPEFILGPLREGIQAAADGIGSLFEPIITAIQEATLAAFQALDQLPNVDLSGDIASLEKALFGQTPLERAAGAGLGGSLFPPPGEIQSATEASFAEANDAMVAGAAAAEQQGTADLQAAMEAEQANRAAMIEETGMGVDVGVDAQKLADNAITGWQDLMHAAASGFIPTVAPALAAELDPGQFDDSRDAAVQATAEGFADLGSTNTEPVKTAGEQMAGGLVTQLAAGLTTAITDASAEEFAPVGAALGTKLQESLATSLTPTNTDALTGRRIEGGGEGIGTQLVSNLATSLASSVEAAPPETFQAVGNALGSKLQQALGTALTTTAAGEGVMVGADAAGGAAGNMMEALATSLAASVTAAPPEAFLPVGEALSQKLQSALSVAMQISPSAMLGGGGGMTGTGDTTTGGAGEAMVLSLATSLAAQVQAASPDSFAPVGQALSAKLQEALSTSLSTAPSAGLPGGGMTGTGGGTGGGIGQQLITSIVSQITAAAASANFSAVGQQIGTSLVTAIGQGLGSGAATVISALQAVITSAIAGAQSAAAGAQAIGTAIVTAVGQGLGAGAGTVIAAMQAVITSTIAAGQGAAAAAQAIGTAITTAAGQGIGAGAGTLISAVQAMVTTAIAAGVGAAAGASAIGAAISAGAAAGIDVNALVGPAVAMVNNAIAAAQAAAGAASPSKVAMEEIGEPISQGAAIGIENDAPSVIESARQMAIDGLQAAIDALNGQQPQLEAAGAGIGSSLSSGIGTGMNQALPDITGMAGSLIDQITGDTWSRIKGQWGGEMPAWAHQVQQLANDRRSSALGEDGQPVQIHLTTELDGQALDDRIIETSIGGLMKVPGRGAGRNGMRVR